MYSLTTFIYLFIYSFYLLLLFLHSKAQFPMCNDNQWVSLQILALMLIMVLLNRNHAAFLANDEGSNDLFWHM